MSKSTSVGMFVAIGLALFMASLFMIGENRKFWDRKVVYRAVFADVVGLKAGAPVRMGGIDVGNVSSVSHSDDPNDSRIHVEVAIVSRESKRIRIGSTARIVNKGLLGDKMIELVQSSPKNPQLVSGGELTAEEPVDISSYVSKAEGIVNNAGKIAQHIEVATHGLEDPKLADDVKGLIASVRSIVQAIEQQDGVAHQLVYNREMGQTAERTVHSLEGISRQMEGVSADLKAMTSQARVGPGLAHSVIYGRELDATLTATLGEVQQSLAAIREKNGIAHAVIYGDELSKKLLINIDNFVEDLRIITNDMRSGRGTVGALLVDPSLYEDLKTLVGSVERNQVLRALVRYAIKADEKQSVPKVDSAN